jgi:K+-transporting ATPase ATPase A chain
MKLAASYFLVTPLIVLLGTAIAMALPGERASMLNSGPHGLSEVLYAFTSGANNNGSAFAGLSANTVWYNTAIGLAMVIGRFLPIVLALALAGSLARQGHTPESPGTLPTYRPQFVGMVAGVTVILLPSLSCPLALGPLAEGIHCAVRITYTVDRAAYDGCSGCRHWVLSGSADSLESCWPLSPRRSSPWSVSSSRSRSWR